MVDEEVALIAVVLDVPLDDILGDALGLDHDDGCAGIESLLASVHQVADVLLAFSRELSFAGVTARAGVAVDQPAAGVRGDAEAAELHGAGVGGLGVEVEVEGEAAHVELDVGAERALDAAVLTGEVREAGGGALGRGGLLRGGEAGECDGGTDAERSDGGDLRGGPVGGLAVGVRHC